MNQVNLAGRHVVGNHRAQGRLNQISAGRALIVAEDFHGDRRRARAIGLYRRTERRRWFRSRLGSGLRRGGRRFCRRRRARLRARTDGCAEPTKAAAGRHQRRAMRAPSATAELRPHWRYCLFYESIPPPPSLNRNFLPHCSANSAGDDGAVAFRCTTSRVCSIGCARPRHGSPGNAKGDQIRASIRTARPGSCLPQRSFKKSTLSLNKNIALQTHKKLDNDRLNVYDCRVSTGPEPGGRKQEQTP